MAESSAIPQLQGLEIEAVEWLPSGADSGLVRVRGRWTSPGVAQPGLPELGLRAGGTDHRFESLPDARFARDPASWRGSYLVPGTLVATAPDALWVEWPGGVRCGLPPLARGLATPPAPAEPPPEAQGGQLIDRAVLAERRARRAEAAEREQARVAAEALRAVEALELQSAELERRLAEAAAERDALAAAAAPAVQRGAGGARAASAASRAASTSSAEQLARLAERRQAALASALDSLARLRAQSREWRLALRTGELTRSGDAVRLAVLEAERAGDATARGALKTRTRELAEERARVASLETVRAELEAGLAEARGEAAEARAELERAGEAADARLTAAIAAADATREQLERRRRGEQTVHEEVRAELRGRLEAAESRANALEAAQAELAADRDSAVARAESLGVRIADLETALAVAESGLATAEASAANAEARLRVEAVARAALEAELDRAREGGDAAQLAAALEAERAARAAERDALVVELDPHASAYAAELAADLQAERDARAAAETDLAAARAETGALREELAAARAGFEADLAAEREARAAAEAALAEAFDAAARQGRTLQERIAELERGAAGLADEVRLANAAREQAEAAGAAAAPPAEQSGRMVADLDAAAAALRDAAPAAEPEPAAPAAEPEPAVPAVEPEAAAPAAEPEAAAPAVEPEPAAPAAEPEPVAPVERVRPTIVSASGPPPRVDATGRSARDYPLLRGAIVKLAHDDPAAAGRLLAALLPAQAAVLAAPLDYDLTIAEVGTFAVTIGESTRVHARPEPRGRGHADFHLSADALTLAELLVGVDHRIGRWRGRARFSGSRRKLDVLRSLPPTTISLSEAARAGADLQPALVYRTLSYAVHPSWTKGERFTLSQEITGEKPETWFLSARDGAGMTVSANPPEEGVEATVSMSRSTFSLMLRNAPLPSGDRPVVRGDRRVVALVKAWMDRAQHGV